MGVNCIIRLPEDVRIRDVAIVMGILAGCEKEIQALQGGTESVCVPGARVEGQVATPELASIYLRGSLIDGEACHYSPFSYENRQGGRVLFPPSTDFWCAIGRGLVFFFGGSVLYSEGDEVEIDLEISPPKWRSLPDPDEEWAAFQTRLKALEPAVIQPGIGAYGKRTAVSGG